MGVKLPQDSTELPMDGNSGPEWSRSRQGSTQLLCGIGTWKGWDLVPFPEPRPDNWLLRSLVLPDRKSTELGRRESTTRSAISWPDNRRSNAADVTRRPAQSLFLD